MDGRSDRRVWSPLRVLVLAAAWLVLSATGARAAEGDQPRAILGSVATVSGHTVSLDPPLELVDKVTKPVGKAIADVTKAPVVRAAVAQRPVRQATRTVARVTTPIATVADSLVAKVPVTKTIDAVAPEPVKQVLKTVAKVTTPVVTLADPVVGRVPVVGDVVADRVVTNVTDPLVAPVDVSAADLPSKRVDAKPGVGSSAVVAVVLSPPVVDRPAAMGEAVGSMMSSASAAPASTPSSRQVSSTIQLTPRMPSVATVGSASSAVSAPADAPRSPQLPTPPAQPVPLVATGAGSGTSGQATSSGPGPLVGLTSSGEARPALRCLGSVPIDAWRMPASPSLDPGCSPA